MNAVTQICAALASVILIAVFPAEAFFIGRPSVQRFLGVEPERLEDVHLWSFNIGFRNALAGVGTLIGLVMVNTGDVATGTVVVVVGLVYMLGTALAMGLSDLLGYWRPRGGSVRGTLASSVLPAGALVALAV
ncbi:DUF1304 family protein [Ornithinimicrobium pekingense]|uniref:Membrane protein n=1 Tax=Ornithinimicrobium pekingense TaxID=384677 RepID=A0ABQ2F5F6_9MICO|nr:DUF1304 family protein [Ornithinimicrobium pekingense]GGK60307.1 membrane protein [Ornithinimicrobium pekingense]